MPLPVSCTASRTCWFSLVKRTVIPPARVNLKALETKLSTTFSHMSRSTYVRTSKAGASIVKVRLAFSTAERKTLASSAVNVALPQKSRRF
jgi:hypothetical protein